MLGSANLTYGRESFYCRENKPKFYDGLIGFTCPLLSLAIQGDT